MRLDGYKLRFKLIISTQTEKKKYSRLSRFNSKMFMNEQSIFNEYVKWYFH